MEDINKVVQQKEKELEKLKSAASKKAWDKAKADLTKWCQGLVNQDIIRFSSCSGYSVTRITSFHETYYINLSGYSGQWDSRRWFVLKGTTFFFTADGKYGCKPVEYSPGMSIGVPIKNKAVYGKEYRRFLETGKIEIEESVFEIGEAAYKANNPNELLKHMTNFCVFARIAPAGLFDDLSEVYHKQILAVEELRKKYLDANVGNLKRI